MPAVTPLPARPHPRHQVAWAGSVLLALATLTALFCFDPSQYAFYPGCLFRRTTGLLCPGCGSLRAMHHLLHGEVATAFTFNPLLIASLPLALWFAARWGLAKCQGRPAALSLTPKWFWIGLALAVAFGVLRNLPGGPFAALPR